MPTDPKQISKVLHLPFPPETLDEKQGNTYVPAEFVRQRLIEATDNQFDWKIDFVDYRQDGAVKERNDRSGKPLGMPIIAICGGTLTIPGLGSRSGIGTQVIEFGGGEDAAYKGAESDALKRAAMAFGVGLQQLYIDTHKSKRTLPAPATSRPQTRQHRPKQAPEPLTDKQFDEEVRQAMASKDGARFKALMDEADDLIGRWIVLIGACETPQSLDWIKKNAERKGVTENALVKDAIEKREKVLASDSF